MTKTCSNCKEIKTTDSFHKSKRTSDGLSSWCASCANESSIKWQANNKEHRRNYLKGWRLRTLYGITEEDYKRIMTDQDGTCAICKGATGDLDLCVDHDHKTSAPRGLLCRTCNLGIGKMGDDPDRLIAAAQYLQTRRYDDIKVSFPTNDDKSRRKSESAKAFYATIEGKQRRQSYVNVKLTEDIVKDIKRRCGQGESQKSLALEYGCSPSHISKIMSGKKWAYV